MISGAGGVVVQGLVHSSVLNGGREFGPVSSIPRTLFARSAVANNARLESISAPSLTQQALNSVSPPVLQQQLYYSKNEDGVEVWKASDFSLSAGAMSAGAPNGRRFISEIAAGTTEATGVQGGLGGSSVGEAPVQSEDTGAGFAFTFVVKRIKDAAKKAEMLKEEVTSLDLSVSPTPYTPVEGPEALKFASICALLFFIFWLGNYFVPDLIFKDVFKKDEDPPSTTSEDNKLEVSNQQTQDRSIDASKINVDDTERSPRMVGTGFGRIKPKHLKSAKRK